MSEENELPEGWVWTRVGEIYDIVGGGTPSTNIEEYWEGDIAWVTSADIFDLKDIRPRKQITKAAIENSATNLVPEGSIIVVTRVGLGKVALAKMPLCFSQDSQALIGDCSSVYPDYSLYYLAQAVQVFKYQSRGTTIAGVTKKQLAELPFSLPPIAEQYRIVAEVEKQLTRLDAGVAALRRARAKLKRYRAAVLKAAVEGKLTEAWRAEHPTSESASILLERILKERRAKWEADLKAKGNDPTKVKYVEPAKPDMEGLPELPEGWCWSTLETVADAIDPQPSHRTPPTVEDGVPYVGIGDVLDGKICLNQARRVSTNVFDEHQLRYQLKKGAFIFGKIGTIGRPVKLTEPFNYTLSANVVLIQPHAKFFDANFVFFYMASPFIEKLIVEGSRATTQAAFGIQKVRLLPFPLPSLIEQNEIVLEVERRLSVVSQLEATIEANLKRAERFRQSILKEAFAGRLVPQDPNDEPASVLLERIRKEREGQKKGANGNGRFVRVSDEPVQIDVEGTRQVELWEGVGEASS